MRSDAPTDVDAFCRVARLRIGAAQVEAIAGAGCCGPRERAAALERAVMAAAWSAVGPAGPASEWLRVVQPLSAPLGQMAPDEPILVLVAGLRRALAERAAAGEEAARVTLERARASFGQPDRARIAGLLALVARGA